jgi:hypothetical protein
MFPRTRAQAAFQTLIDPEEQAIKVVITM